MKKLLIVLLIISNALYAQHLGFNGSGFFENYDDQAIEWLEDLDAPFTIRIPGGAISKFHDPYNVRRGWGMSEENIRAWYKSVGFDEDGQGFDKWINKASMQPDRSFLDDMITLQKKFPNMQVLYVLNVMNSTPEANMQAIRYLIDGGVKIVGVEAGNEVYGKYASFAEYAKDFEPIFKLVRKEYPDIELGLCAASYKGIKSKEAWNEQMSQYRGDYNAVIIHYYYGSKDMSEAFNQLPSKKAAGETLDKSMDNAFRLAAKTLYENTNFENQIRLGKEQFPGKEIWITEWNTKPNNAFGNTILNGGWQFLTMVEMRDEVEYLIMHTGVSPDVYGMISRKMKHDSEKTNLVRRMGYWAFKLASEVEDGIKIEKGKSYKLSSEDDDDICYYFVNFDDAYEVSIDYGNLNVKSATMHYVTGKNIYSSSGTTGFLTKGETPSYEVNKVNTESFEGMIPKHSFGYIKVELN